MPCSFSDSAAFFYIKPPPRHNLTCPGPQRPSADKGMVTTLALILFYLLRFSKMCYVSSFAFREQWELTTPPYLMWKKQGNKWPSSIYSSHLTSSSLPRTVERGKPGVFMSMQQLIHRACINSAGQDKTIFQIIQMGTMNLYMPAKCQPLYFYLPHTRWPKATWIAPRILLHSRPYRVLTEYGQGKQTNEWVKTGTNRYILSIYHKYGRLIL